MRTWLPLLLAALLSGCSVRTIALRQTVGLLDKGTLAVYQESDVQFARDAMPGQLKLIESLLQNETGNPDLLTLCAQGFGGYAFLFLEDENPGRAKAFYLRGRNYGLSRLNAIAGAELLDETDITRFEVLLSKMSRKDAPALFWTAYCWGRLAYLDLQNPQTLADLPKIELLMRRANQLSPGFFYGGADLFLGAYYGSRPKMFGGDLKKSREFFEQALDHSRRRFLMGQVLYALHYAVPAQDRELFRDLLKEVLDFPAENFPEQRLSNEVAKQRAKKLLENINEYF
jgi:hypothetical protein